MYYSLVGQDGYILLSLVTQDPDYSVEPGQHLLPDNPPDPRKGDYQPGVTRPVRVEPVPPEATEVPYRIVDELQEILENPNPTSDYAVTSVPEVKL